MNFDVSIMPFDKDGITHNSIRVTLDYDKRATGPVLDMRAADIGDKKFRFSIFGSPSGRLTWDAGWRSNNAKKMASARLDVKAQLEAKAGRAWDMVKDFAAKNGLTLQNPERAYVTASGEAVELAISG